MKENGKQNFISTSVSVGKSVEALHREKDFRHCYSVHPSANLPAEYFLICKVHVSIVLIQNDDIVEVSLDDQY